MRLRPGSERKPQGGAGAGAGPAPRSLAAIRLTLPPQFSTVGRERGFASRRFLAPLLDVTKGMQEVKQVYAVHPTVAVPFSGLVRLTLEA